MIPDLWMRFCFSASIKSGVPGYLLYFRGPMNLGLQNLGIGTETF